jgi:two-component system, cell cycle sensor histidine kinase and response regulator CckA
MPPEPLPPGLTEPERYFRDMAHHVRSIFWVVTEDLELVYLSPIFEEMLGWPVQEMMGPLERFLATIHPEDRGQVAEWIRERLRGRDSGTVEYRVQRPDGEPRWLRTRAFPVPDPDGEVRRSAGLTDDVTEERLARLELEETTRRLKQTFASLGEAVFVVEPRTRQIVECNRSAERIFGYGRDELIGSDTRKLHVSETRYREFSSLLDPTLEREGVVHAEWEMRRRDGTIFASAHTVALLDPEAGLDRGVVSVVRDVSEQRTLEMQLRQAQKMEAVGRLAGGIAHDFNNLLTVIRGHSEMIREALGPDSPLREDLDEVLAEVDRATTLTRQLLAFSRKQVMDERVLDLRGVLARMEAPLRRLVPANVELAFPRSGPALPVRLDPAQMHQVVLNLVVNAIQAMEDRGRITLSLASTELTEQAAEQLPWEARPGPYARLSVEDTGHGMPPHVLERIFEPFFTTKPAGEGTGLGLPTAFGIVKQSRGHILTESEPGRGTRFEILLPLMEAEVEAPGEPSPSIPASSWVGPAPTVLLVEDEASVRRVVTRGLERLGFEVLVASDGQEALDRISVQGPEAIDIVVSDVIMPRLGGTAYVERLQEAMSPGRIILMSGYSEAEVARDIQAKGITFLSKPFSVDELAQRIRKVLSAD